jgi:hypothetical protein
LNAQQVAPISVTETQILPRQGGRWIEAWEFRLALRGAITTTTLYPGFEMLTDCYPVPIAILQRFSVCAAACLASSSRYAIVLSCRFAMM